ncbi:glucose-6-phosphate dehydrogenase [Gleimia hominis]|uniref:glucose-6-phosphate dehydrogenase n=1 Tax=Gleimia hominis TaxID=595468 RepID=UPI000C7FFDC7|nr:glucose-6-phosphate dehydrogenase [Gleimia hominis]WIK65031.1 glucose-6-phosphate dehydrogenase [Gleimia hominis]
MSTHEPPSQSLHDPRDKRLPVIAPPCGLVIFGITGDLARKKLVPALYDLSNRGLLHPSFSLTGFARRDWGSQDFEDFIRDSVKKNARTDWDENTWEQFSAGLRFVAGSFDDSESFDQLAQTVKELDHTRGTGGNHAFYLAIPPAAFPKVVSQLVRSGLNDEWGEDRFRRVIVEKPFGHDLESAKELSDLLHGVFSEKDTFRIDHYLGKETVQNILAMRFSNIMFEPLLNSNYVDHVQITMAEEIGIGTRAGYYDGIGQARDVMQNHLLQLLALTAMEEPVTFGASDVHVEKEKVLSALRLPKDLESASAIGQYTAGYQGGEHVRGYLEEDNIDQNSRTETFAALKLFVDTRRWAGVPFYLRTGKRLGKRVTEIAIVFKRAAHIPFDKESTEELGNNALVIRVQPFEGVTIRFGSKVPGVGMRVRDVTMDFGYGHAFTEDSPEAYERLLLDALAGDSPLFPNQREVELSWQTLDPVLKYWGQTGGPQPYRPGTWGPESAEQMMAHDGRTWRIP